MKHGACFAKFRQFAYDFKGMACICLMLVALSGCGSDSPTYTVSYDDNVPGETVDVPAESAAFAKGTVVTLSSSIPERTGYAFAGWNTAPDGTGTGYSAGGTLTIGTADVTLYAQWTTGPTHTITYDDNVDGELIDVPTASTGYVAGTMVALSSSVPERPGYTFAGWNTLPDGTGTGYAAGGTLTIGAADVTLYAQWTTEPTYTIVFDDNVADEVIEVPTTSSGFVAGTVVRLSSGIPERTGHTFTSWNTARDGSGTTYAAGATLTIGAADVTLYAQWAVAPSVTYDANLPAGTTLSGGSVPTDNASYSVGDTVTVAGDNGMTVSGYRFDSWNGQADGLGTTYSGSFTIAGDTTLYARWAAVYTVTYDGNANDGGTVPTDGNAYVEGESVIVSADDGNLVRGGYAFGGWNTAANGGGTPYDASGSATFSMPASNVTLYTRWLEIFGIAYTDPSGESGNLPGNGSFIENDASFTITSTVPVRDGYVFEGWYTDASFGGTRYLPGDVYSVTGNGDVTFHANWVEAGVLTAMPIALDTSYTVTFEDNDGDGTPQVQSQTVAPGYTVLPPRFPPVRTGYVFAGWYGDQALTRVYDFETAVTGDVTLYARWISLTVSYTVSFEGGINAPPPQTVPEGASAADPGEPVVESGYTFIYWRDLDKPCCTPFDFNAPITADQTIGLYISLGTPVYTVSFDDNDDDPASNQIPSQSNIEGRATTEPAAPPVIYGADFAGWYSDAGLTTPYDFDTQVASDITLYGKWIERWAIGDLAAAAQNTEWYYFDAVTGSEYEIAWEDSNDGGDRASGDVRVTAYRGDLASTVFAAVDNGYGGNAQRYIATADERIYLKVEVESGDAGSYAVRLSRKYEVGDTGPGGGLIFYVDDGTYGSTLWTYLEAAPASYDAQHHWGPYQLAAYGTNARGLAIPGSNRTGLGTGYDNTGDFIASQTAGPQVDANFGSEPIYYAAQQAASLSITSQATGNRFDDWFLPASDTLRAMYDALYAADYDNDGAPDNIGEFVDTQNASFYWASTEEADIPCDGSCQPLLSYYASRAWSLDVGGGVVDVDEQKRSAYYVRAVRRF